MLHETLLFLHSLLRWAVLGLALNALVRAYRGKSQGLAYTSSDRKGALAFVATLHLTTVIGLTQFFATSPLIQAAFASPGAAMKTAALRFFLVEHPTTMLLAVVLATVGSARIKRGSSDAQKHSRTLVFFGIALALIFIGIPWPFYPAGRPLLHLPQ